MTTASAVRFLLRLALDATRLGCAKLVLFTILAFPYLVVLQKRAHAQPKTAPSDNPFTYRLQ